MEAGAGGFNKRCGAYSRKYGTKRYYDGSKRRPQISATFLEKKLVRFGTFLMHCVTCRLQINCL